MIWNPWKRLKEMAEEKREALDWAMHHKRERDSYGIELEGLYRRLRTLNAMACRLRDDESDEPLDRIAARMAGTNILIVLESFDQWVPETKRRVFCEEEDEWLDAPDDFGFGTLECIACGERHVYEPNEVRLVVVPNVKPVPPLTAAERAQARRLLEKT